MKEVQCDYMSLLQSLLWTSQVSRYHILPESFASPSTPRSQYTPHLCISIPSL